MNEQLQKKLVEMIEVAQKAGTEAFLFTKEQVPDVIRQLLLWKMAEAGAYIFLGLVLIGVGATVCYFIRADVKKAKYGMIEGHLILGLFAGMVPTVVGFIVAFANLFPILQIWIAPKVYLLEYLKEIVK